MITDTLTAFSKLLRGDRSLLASGSGNEASAAQALPAHLAGLRRPTTWGMQVLAQMEWQRFEALMEAFFQQAGLMTRARSLGPGQGVDIWLYSRHQSGTAVSLARCRQQLPGHTLTAADVAGLTNTLADKRVNHGQWVVGSPVDLTPEARQLARQARIQCMDPAGLLKVIEARPPAQQAELLAVATQGEYWRPTCPGCGFKMVAAGQPALPGGVTPWRCARCHGSKPPQ